MKDRPTHESFRQSESLFWMPTRTQRSWYVSTFFRSLRLLQGGKSGLLNFSVLLRTSRHCALSTFPCTQVRHSHLFSVFPLISITLTFVCTRLLHSILMNYDLWDLKNNRAKWASKFYPYSNASFSRYVLSKSATNARFCTPNVKHFSLNIDRSYDIFLFFEFHRIKRMQLPELIQDNFRFKFSCLPTTFDLQKHRSTGPLFTTMIARETQSGPMKVLVVSINWPKKN